MRRILSEIVLLISKMTNFDLRILEASKLGELGTELSGEFVVEVDVESSPLANVLCEKNSDISDPPFPFPLAAGTSPLAANSARNKCGF